MNVSHAHQEHLPKELAASVADMATANCYLQEIYMPAKFIQPAAEEGTAFMPWIDGQLADILCERYERVVGHELQIPAGVTM